MINILKPRLLTLVCFILAIGILSSCEKDDNNDSGKVELLSFGPTGALHGDTLSFIGNHLDKVTEIDFTGASVPKSSFIKQTSELITVIVPQQTEQGFVTLKTADGDIVTKTKLNLEVITSVASITSEARPGENITLTGQYLNWVTSVTFTNDKKVDTFVSMALDKLVLKVPEDAQTGPLVINYAGTEADEFTTTQVVKVTLPVATALAPNPVKHNNNLTITGTNLDLTKEILFVGDTARIRSFVSKSATQIVVNVPAWAKKGKITLFPASKVGSESTQEFDVVLPSITSFTPSPIDPETNLTITGTNLDLVTGISFTGIAAPVTTFVSKSATQIVVKVPKGTLKGKLVMNVLNSTLTVESSQVLDIKGGLPPLADFPFAIYTDATQNTFQDWSYTNTHDFNSTANVRQGGKSIKAVYKDNDYQGVTFHAGTAASTSGYTKLEFSIFGEAGTNGKKLNVVINGNYSNPPQVTIVEGEWSTFSLTLSSLGNPGTLGEVVLQSAGWGGTIHIDHVGLR